MLVPLLQTIRKPLIWPHRLVDANTDKSNALWQRCAINKFTHILDNFHRLVFGYKTHSFRNVVFINQKLEAHVIQLFWSGHFLQIFSFRETCIVRDSNCKHGDGAIFEVMLGRYIRFTRVVVTDLREQIIFCYFPKGIINCLAGTLFKNFIFKITFTVPHILWNFISLISL